MAISLGCSPGSTHTCVSSKGGPPSTQTLPSHGSYLQPNVSAGRGGCFACRHSTGGEHAWWNRGTVAQGKSTSSFLANSVYWPLPWKPPTPPTAPVCCVLCARDKPWVNTALGTDSTTPSPGSGGRPARTLIWAYCLEPLYEATHASMGLLWHAHKKGVSEKVSSE